MPVYVFGPVDGLHKIGRTKNLPQRLSVLSRFDANAEVVHTIESAQMGWLEKTLHRVFFDLRVEGEWFRLGVAELNLLRSVRSASCIEELPSGFSRRLKAYEDHRAKNRKSALPISRELFRTLRIVAAHHRMKNGACLAHFAGPDIEREYRKCLLEQLQAVDSKPRSCGG